MAALPSTAGLDLDLARLSLSSPYGHAQYPHPHQHQPYPHHQQHAHSASPSLDHLSGSEMHPLPPARTGSQPPPPAPAAGNGAAPALAPHQIMQPPVHSGPPPHVQLQEPQRRRGVVKFFNSLKGFGFVVDNDPAALGGQEVFCHFSAISGKGGFRSLAEGEEVEYELVQGPKGFQAANLTGPGGRTVVGDPKARMQKPPQYLPFAPMALPIGGPYLDPYHAQHGAVYAGSPYTSHVLYVPATASLPPSQYAYAPIPLAAAPPPSARGAPSPSANGASPFAAPQYQSYAAPPAGSSPIAANGAPASVAQPASVPGGAQDRYGSLTRIGAATGAFGAPSQPAGLDGARGGAPAAAYGAPHQLQHQHQHQPQHAQNAMPSPAFSPPGGAFGLPPASPSSNGGPTFGGFAPFSPPSFNHAPLFGAPPPPQGYAAYAPPPAAQAQHAQAPPSSHAQSSSQNTTPSSALFGSIPAPGPIGSRSGTPAAGGRSTPALGNGSLGNDAWKTSASPAGSAVL
ncbi:hypothetical protein JCM10213_000009 [Rhodosporidiobolus nylandii]